MSNSTDLEELVPWQRGPTERGGWSIIFSCLAVVVVSTWTALHLNVPKQPDRTSSGPNFALTRKKIKWTIIMIIFPEVLFAKAVLELKMALDDHLAMYERRGSLFLKGWRVEIGFWLFALHQLLDGEWPSKALWRDSFSRNVIHQVGSNTGKSSEASVPKRGHTATGKQQQPVNASSPDLEPHIATAEPVTYKKDESQEETAGLRISIVPQPLESVKDHWPDFRDHDDRTTCGPLYFEPRDLVWTLTHSYFTNMGGITFHSYPVTTIDLVKTLSNSSGVPGDEAAAGAMTVLRENRLTEKIIKDKSKADVLLRTFWIWQIVRLWCELIGRAIARLPVTQVEIITLSFSMIALLIHVLQYAKPKDVECPINFNHAQVYFIDKRENFQSLSYAYVVPSSSADRSWGLWSRIPNDIFREKDRSLFLITTTSSTVLFGAIHCIGWQFNFPTKIEQWTWRACALAGIILPLMMMAFAWIGNPSLRRLEERRASAQTQFTTALGDYHAEARRAVPQWMWSSLEPSSGSKKNRHSTHRDSASQMVQRSIAGVPLERLPNEIRSLVNVLRDLAKRADDAHSAREKFLRNRVYYQYPAILIYLMTRIAIIIIAFTSFRRAPRGIYKGTWASVWPTFQ